MRLARCVALVVTASLGVAPSALAAPGWTAPAALPATWGVASLGFDATGTATAGHVDLPGSQLGLALRAPDGSFTDQLSLPSTSDSRFFDVDVAVGADGAATACAQSFVDPNSPTERVRYAATYRAAGATTWEPLVTLATSASASSFVTRCSAAVAPDGSAALLFSPLTEARVSGQPEKTQVRLATHAPSGAWTVAELSPLGEAAGQAQLGVDAAGTVTALWLERYAGQGTPGDFSDDKYGLRARTRTTAGVVSPAEEDVLDGGGDTASTPSLGVNAAGQAVASWQWTRPSGQRVWAAVRDSATGDFGSPVQLPSAPGSGGANSMAAGIAPNGTAHVLYRDGNSASERFFVVRRPLGEAFSGAQPVSEPGLQEFFSAYAFLGNDAFAVSTAFSSSAPDTNPFAASRWTADATAPDLSRDLTPTPTPVTLEQTLPDRDGSVVVTYGAGNPGRPTVVAYDGGAPQLVSSAVPAAAATGAVTALTARWADAWSAVVPTTWDFGDGGTATGDAVTHAWAAPGSYTVTARDKDALGNEASRTFAVAVATPPPPAPAPPSVVPVPVRDRTAPTVTLALPTCAKKVKKAACAKRRTTRSAWRIVRGTARDAVGVTRVTLTAKRAKRGKLKARTITVVAKRSGSAWSATVKGLTPGRWTFGAVATDAAGNRSKAASRTVTLR